MKDLHFQRLKECSPGLIRENRTTEFIDRGDQSPKPGWVRLSLHPTISNQELHYIIDAIDEVIQNTDTWSKDYRYSSSTNEFYHYLGDDKEDTAEWFVL